MPVNPDPRARAWWDGDFAMGPDIYESIEYSYDLFLVYEAGPEWDSSSADSPGEPAFFQTGHTEGFDEDDFEEEVELRLPTCDEIVTD